MGLVGLELSGGGSIVAGKAQQYPYQESNLDNGGWPRSAR
jgi:hypothetical protein